MHLQLVPPRPGVKSPTNTVYFLFTAAAVLVTFVLTSTTTTFPFAFGKTAKEVKGKGIELCEYRWNTRG